MSSRRSSRRAAAAASSARRATIPPSVQRGLMSLIEGNEAYIAKMLSLDASVSKNNNDIEKALEECMGMNNLSAEMMLARFFDESVLSRYSTEVLEKSGKGSSATLAERIAREWAKPNFQLPSTTTSEKKRKGEEGKKAEKSSTKKKKENLKDSDDGVDDDDDDGDWKRPLFFWKGTLKQTGNEEKGKLHWEGSWVSGLAKDGLPTLDEFEKTKESASFKLSSTGMKTDSKVEKDSDDDSSPLSPLLGLSGSFSGDYMLDQGDGEGPSEFSDLTHHFAFGLKANKNNKLLVAACGTTEFGSFVSMGYIQAAVVLDDGVQEWELVLARRYIADKDKRNRTWVKKKKPILILDEFPSVDPDSSSFWSNVLPRAT